MKRPAKRFLVAFGGTITVLAAAWWLISGPNPDIRARHFANALTNHEWGDIYDMASETERSRQEWGRANFVALMSSIAGRKATQIGAVDIQGDWSGQTTWKMFFFRFRATDAGGKVENVELLVPFY